MQREREMALRLLPGQDATASYSEDHMHAALEVNIPNYATAIVTTDEIVAAISSLKALGSRAQVLHQGAGHV